MSATWTTVLGLCVATAAIKGAGPVLLGGRELPAWRRDAMLAVVAAAALTAAVLRALA